MKTHLTPLALAVLRLLHTGPMHPYEMQQRIRDWGIDEVVKVTHGALYHTVERLMRAELIEPTETSRTGKRPERTIYGITDSGRELTVDCLNDLLSGVDREFPKFRTALAFLSLLPPEEAKERLRMRAVRLEAELSATKTAYDALIKNGVPRIHLIEVDHMTGQTRAELDVVRTIVEEIESGQLTWSPNSLTSGKAHHG
jgi:DNA-binding PadR family transcriptional regulator